MYPFSCITNSSSSIRSYSRHCRTKREPVQRRQCFYRDEKVSPLPSTEALDQHSHKSNSPLDPQNFIQHLLPRGAPTTGTSLPDQLEHTRPGCGAALDADGQQTCRQQAQDKPVLMTKTDSTATTSMFMPPPLIALFPPVAVSTGISGGSLSLHHIPTGYEGGDALTTSPFPVAAHFSTPVQFDAPVNDTAMAKSTTRCAVDWSRPAVCLHVKHVQVP